MGDRPSPREAAASGEPASEARAEADLAARAMRAASVDAASAAAEEEDLAADVVEDSGVVVVGDPT